VCEKDDPPTPTSFSQSVPSCEGAPVGCVAFRVLRVQKHGDGARPSIVSRGELMGKFRCYPAGAFVWTGAWPRPGPKNPAHLTAQTKPGRAAVRISQPSSPARQCSSCTHCCDGCRPRRVDPLRAPSRTHDIPESGRLAPTQRVTSSCRARGVHTARRRGLRLGSSCGQGLRVRLDRD
jgi:hypothetical protein